MTAAFDIAAAAYDTEFTRSLIGKSQRAAVRTAMLALIREDAIKTILEFNCGTGEDAMWLSSLGLDVTATDISDKMLEAARSKPGKQIIARADLNAIEGLFSNRKFDCVFSNFGGLNCLSPAELMRFFNNVKRFLPDNGSLILVVMPKATLWEKIYFTVKGQFGQLARRNQAAAANVSGSIVETHYYNPDQIAKMADGFEVQRVTPVGFFVPPSYLESWALKFPKLLQIAKRADKAASRIAMLAKYSDHYLISLKKL